MRSARMLLLLLVPASALHAETYEEALALYKRFLQRPSLHKRVRGRERLADTGDLRALEILAASYRKPEAPKDQVQYLIVDIATDCFADAEALPVFEKWRARCRKPEDAWLWFKSLVPHYEGEGSGELEAIVRGSEPLFLRLAALEVLRFRQAPALLGLVTELAGAIPASGLERALLMESLGACLLNFREIRKTPAFQTPFDALCRAMDEPATSERTRIVLARHLRDVLEVKFVFRLGGKWIQELEIQRHGGKQATLDGYAAAPTFAGIEATGDRICYVIDFSDSMLTPLTVGELAKLPKGPVSGSGVLARKEKESESAAWKKAFEAVRWDKVKTRFDAARELLKTSLLCLGEHQSFAVIGFGNEAEPLAGSKGMTRASPANIQRIFKELDSIRTGPPGQDRPHGTLRGYTNLHGGIHRAFKLKERGLVGPGEYVDPVTFEEGCDTIFILSDGDPTWDDWASQDARDREDQVGDPESGSQGSSDATMLNFPGPYRIFRHLAEDVRRLNLFRRVEIHCVGMGEATMGTLQRLAAIGRGEAISLRGVG